jgi:hypothetical protein
MKDFKHCLQTNALRHFFIELKRDLLTDFPTFSIEKFIDEVLALFVNWIVLLEAS